MPTIEGMDVTGEWPTTKYDGCGKCLVGGVRLSRKSESTGSPEKQRDQIIEVVEANGAHIVAWAKDLEVSGATDPFTRPELGPWLRDMLGPYDGLACAAVDRIGRDVYEGLNLARYLHRTGRLLYTYNHFGPWNLANPNEENDFLFSLFGAQMELRAIQRRNRETTVKARKLGRKANRHSYGFRYVRMTPRGAIDEQILDPHSSKVARKIAARILSAGPDEKITPATEAVRLNRAGELTPGDYEAVEYGRKPKGATWTAKTIEQILTSYASVGYLTHDGLPVIGKDGNRVRLCEGLWDDATRLALIEKIKPKREGSRAPKSKRLLSGRVQCGQCGVTHYLSGRPLQWRCTGRVRGLQVSKKCAPSPGMLVTKLDALVTSFFLTRFGPTPIMKRIFDPGSGHAGRIAELEADQARLQGDRDAGLYDEPEREAWFRKTYKAKSDELAELKEAPTREAKMRSVPTGETVADQWERSDAIERREILASYGVHVEMYPDGHSPRLWIHTLDPNTLNEARWAFFDDAEQDRQYAYAEAVINAIAEEYAAQDALPDAVETDPGLWPMPQADADADVNALVA